MNALRKQNERVTLEIGRLFLPLEYTIRSFFWYRDLYATQCMRCFVVADGIQTQRMIKLYQVLANYKCATNSYFPSIFQIEHQNNSHS